MTRRQLWVNAGIVALLCGICVLCYRTGKAYDLILENVPYSVEGKEYPAVEALQATIDTQRNPVYLLEGDREVGMAVGLNHRLKIEILDSEDKVVETRVVAFSVDELGKDRVLNVAKMFAHGKKIAE